MSGSAWQDSGFSLVIITANGNFQGLFVYSPSPGTGNLVASIAAAAGTDPYANAYRAGFTSYGASDFSQMVNGFFESGAFTDFAPAEWVAGAGLASLNSGAQTNLDAQSLLRLFSKLASPNSVLQVVISQQAGGPAPVTSGLLEVQGEIDAVSGDLVAATAGSGVRIATGSNARMGTGSLSTGGTAVIANTSVTANTHVFLTASSTGANSGAIGVSSKTAGTGFTVQSSNAADRNSFTYLLVDPA